MKKIPTPRTRINEITCWTDPLVGDAGSPRTASRTGRDRQDERIDEQIHFLDPVQSGENSTQRCR
ncbi:hypothetical protein CC117_00970 [Parafrankia colletiae]|uniref:Uncharacterized protein n=1 Tax=Parafrankia colletiae TaxID=573497 RepID=A0A1S1RHM5_9ACTN|nr:hypothetical protein [Frankia sp. Cpl3]OHV46253.1 hypothetical protein CC117_00970 [Parafrankia colletiae]